MLPNRQIILRSRPPGHAEEANFAMVDAPMCEPADGQVSLQVLTLSIEPYMLLSMKGSIPVAGRPEQDRFRNLGDRYMAGAGLGEVMCGPTVSRVIRSRNREFAEGDIVLSYSGWQQYALDDCSAIRKLAPGIPPSAALGVAGIPGLTAYAGMRVLGRPRAGETVVVSAALGPVGSLAGQIARLDGARAVGVASTEAKCQHLVEELGFDAAVDRKAQDFGDRLAAACPDGVDVYFDNVGGPILQSILPLFNAQGRLPISGLAAHYGDAHANSGPDRTAELLHTILLKRLVVSGVQVFDYGELLDTFDRDIAAWIASGEVKWREDISDGLESAPRALIDVLSGRNVGKKLIRVAE